MKLAVISDIHSNAEALSTCLNYIRDQKIDKVYCLGDIIGYGPNPNQCMEMVLNQCEIILTGNHDYALLNSDILNHFSFNAQKGIEYTRKVLLKNYLDKIPEFDLKYKDKNIYLSHSNYSDPLSWSYLIYYNEVMQDFAKLEFGIPLFVGHSHVPIIYEQDRKEKLGRLDPQDMILDPGKKYIVNIGSVGQPRDRCPKSSFVIYDTDKREVNYIRLSYDVKAVADKIKNEPELPDFLGERLFYGQ